ncbi:MAG: glycosyltransferase [Desulfovibrio sp.]|jgi:glycosyltransferase involved in cell wall biosynthesis|nr:glycosyltransferase [Desulfovibrio sp.]
MLKVGYERSTYAEKRLFINKVREVKFVRVASEAINLPGLTHDDVYWASNINRNDIDLMHYFNQVNFGETPYITTFETIVPRFFDAEPFDEYANMLLQDNCKKIIALSKKTMEIQANRMKSSSRYKLDHALNKLCFLYPPQKIIFEDHARFFHTEKISFIFIGNAFLTKGFIPIMNALNYIHNIYHDITFTVVSSFVVQECEYPLLENDPDILYKINEFLNKNADWITVYSNLPNSHVLKLLPLHHVGLLPSLAETYGYVVLEMQAAGIPVVTTDIRSFPEINNDACGFVIKIPSKREFRPTDFERYCAVCKIIEAKLIKIIEEILKKKDTLYTKSQKAIRRIKKYHDPEYYSSMVNNIYQNI